MKGKWELKDNKNQINYPILYFKEDSTAIFTSRADTVYRFKYSFKNDYIILKNTFTPEITEWKILRLSNDELVFKSLLEHKDKQVYKRGEK